MNYILLFFFFFLVSCNDSKKVDVSQFKPKLDGKEIFSQRCVACHGSNGKLGFSGAKDLTVSKFTVPQIINQVTNGKGAMTPFKNILTTDEIMEVANYCKTLQIK